MRRNCFSAMLLAMMIGGLASGCSEIHGPKSAMDVVTHPFGTQPPFVRGTSKAKVLDSWGKPDAVVLLGVDELGNVREEWIYKGRLPGMPIDYEYVSRTKHLIFEGNNMVNWKTEEAPTAS